MARPSSKSNGALIAGPNAIVASATNARME
jgi:hypothetical protein